MRVLISKVKCITWDIFFRPCHTALLFILKHYQYNIITFIHHHVGDIIQRSKDIHLTAISPAGHTFGT